jgi:predicted AAA+ superfamily ATPase
MKKEILKEIIRDFHVAPLPSVIERDAVIPFNSGKIITLVGARRSGKTYVLYNLMNKLMKSGLDFKNILYINFEDERIDLKLNELDLILRAYNELYPDLKMKNCYLFFDEIQNIENWEKFIRRVYDSLTKNIFITGSNSKFLSSDIATSLRGREVYFYKGKYECDFVVKEGHSISEALQVSSVLSDKKTTEREIRGLTEACKYFGLKKGIIITNDESQDMESDGIRIKYVPLYKWLLS